MCKAPMPERRRTPQQSTSSRQSRYQNTYTPRQGNNQTRRVRHIKDNTDQTEAQNYEGESDEPAEVDAEAPLYIKELTEDWANVNLIRPTTFHTEKNSVKNNEGTGEFWVATTTNNKRIVWLADTGSPRTFMNKETANELLLQISNYISERNQNPGQFFFSKIDLKYAYSQIPLDPTIQKQFQSPRGESNRNIQVHKRLLRPNRHARNIPEND